MLQTLLSRRQPTVNGKTNETGAVLITPTEFGRRILSLCLYYLGDARSRNSVTRRCPYLLTGSINKMTEVFLPWW